MPVLYDYPIAVGSQKIRLALAEKGIAYERRTIDLFTGAQWKPEFLKINPRGWVPALVDGENIILESSIILEYVDEQFGGPSLMPETASGKATVRWWFKQVDDIGHPSLSGTVEGTLRRNMQLEQTREAVLAELDQIREPAHRARRKSLYLNGVDAPEFNSSVEGIGFFLDTLNEALVGRSWIAGEQFTLADCAVLPYINRFNEFGFADLWRNGARSEIERWFGAATARPSYSAAIAADMTPESYAFLEQGGKTMLPYLFPVN